jgi:hypothetical protein
MEDVIVPVVLFLAPALIVWIVSFYNARKRTTVHETLRHAIDKGQALTPEVLERMSLLTDPIRADLRRGVLFIAFGAAFAILGFVLSDQDEGVLAPMLGVSAFPVLLGLAYLGLWAFSRGSKQA